MPRSGSKIQGVDSSCSSSSSSSSCSQVRGDDRLPKRKKRNRLLISSSSSSSSSFWNATKTISSPKYEIEDNDSVSQQPSGGAAKKQQQCCAVASRISSSSSWTTSTSDSPFSSTSNDEGDSLSSAATAKTDSEGRSASDEDDSSSFSNRAFLETRNENYDSEQGSVADEKDRSDNCNSHHQNHRHERLVEEDAEEDRLVMELVQAVFAPLRRGHDRAILPMTLAQWLHDKEPLTTTTIATIIFPAVQQQQSVSPREHLQALLRASGRPCAFVSASAMPERFWEPVTPRYRAGYTLAVAQAVRADNVEALQALYAKNQLVLPCGTQYGDSILHTACRRNRVRVLKYLLQLPAQNSSSNSNCDPAQNDEPNDVYGTVQEQKCDTIHNNDVVDQRSISRSGATISSNYLGKPISSSKRLMSVRFKNDCGRTPLSDCCWTTRPVHHSSSCWHAALLILGRCPDLLYITDRHGSIPLDYVPREYWGDWCRFLDKVGAHRLAPRVIHIFLGNVN